MTFFEQEKPYRVTFDLEENIFIVYSTLTGQLESPLNKRSMT